VIGGFLGLEEFHLQSFARVAHNYNSGSSHYLAPEDFASIYNLTARYQAGIDGTEARDGRPSGFGMGRGGGAKSDDVLPHGPDALAATTYAVSLNAEPIIRASSAVAK
jgi:hypothetical protein